MAREIRKVTPIFGDPYEEIIDDGEKVGEIRTETPIFGDSVKVTYDTDHNKVSTTRTETPIFGEAREVTYDTDHNKLSETHREKPIFGDAKEVTYDPDHNKISETRRVTPIFGPSVKVVEDYRPKNERSNNYSPSSSSSSGSSGWVGGLVTLLVLAGLGIGLVKLISSPNRETRNQGVQEYKQEFNSESGNFERGFSGSNNPKYQDQESLKLKDPLSDPGVNQYIDRFGKTFSEGYSKALESSGYQSRSQKRRIMRRSFIERAPGRIIIHPRQPTRSRTNNRVYYRYNY